MLVIALSLPISQVVPNDHDPVSLMRGPALSGALTGLTSASGVSH